MGKHVKSRSFLFGMLALGILLGTPLYLQVTSNSWHLNATSQFLRAYAFTELPLPTEETLSEIEEDLRRRVDLYIDEIRMHHLDGGLIVNRSVLGGFRDNCDSLLFSSIYVASLIKLGKHEHASQIWNAIQHMQADDFFVRHPNCADKATSRDQILGVVIALSQKPEGYQRMLAQLFHTLIHNNGYFSHGSPSVSYMTPGLADIVRRFARAENIEYQHMPDSIRRSFSTLEFTVPFVKRGYRTHLSALQIWLEMELESTHLYLPAARSFASESTSFFRPFTPQPLSSQRLDYVTQTLVERQPRNLFYRYLRYKSAGAFSDAVRVKLMQELLSMRQFPKTRLPADCDRKADYLWQRASKEFRSVSHECRVIFSGVDFIWMAALLLEQTEDYRTVTH